jgi:hypothetical protein
MALQVGINDAPHKIADAAAITFGQSQCDPIRFGCAANG